MRMHTHLILTFVLMVSHSHKIKSNVIKRFINHQSIINTYERYYSVYVAVSGIKTSQK